MNFQKLQASRILSVYSQPIKTEIKKSVETQIFETEQTIITSRPSSNFLNLLKSQIETKDNLNKAFDNLGGDILEKAIGRAGLVAKKVDIKMEDGTTHKAIRWVKNGSEDSPSVNGTHKWFADAGKGLQGSTPEEQIHHVVNHPDMTPAEKTAHLIHHGIYDKEKLSELSGNGDQNAYDHLYYAGVKNKEFKDEHTKLKNEGSDILQPPGTKPINIPIDMSISAAKEALGGKDFDKFKDVKKKELAAKYGISMDDRWSSYNFKIQEVLLIGYPKSLIAYGSGGVGKTYDLEQNLKELKLREYDDDPELGGMEPDEYDYIKITGSTSKTDLWRIICDNKQKILIFDDCDSMWSGDDDMKNWLKGALDTTGDGTIRYGNGDKVKDRNGDPCPRTVKFTGRAIFVSNLTDKDLPQPLIDSRSSSIDLSMTMDETLDKLEKIKYFVKIKDGEGNEIDASKDDRDHAVDFFKEMKDYLRIEQVNGRTLGQLIGISSALRRMGKYTPEAYYKQALIGLRLV